MTGARATTSSETVMLVDDFDILCTSPTIPTLQLLHSSHGMPYHRLQILRLSAARVAKVDLVVQANIWRRTVYIKRSQHFARIERARRNMARRRLPALCDIRRETVFLDERG